MKKIYLLSIVFACFSASNLFAQGGGQIHGSFKMDAMFYNEDSLIGAPNVPEKIGMNAFGKFIYTNGNFEAGVRFEYYMNPLQGYNPNYEGSGISNRYAKYTKDDFEITVGHFYEQFGSGMILRSYEEWNLGYDNAIDGIRVKANPVKGVYLTGLIGKQRNYWGMGDGLVRAFDADISLNDAFKKLEKKKTRMNVGASFVSKYQEDNNPMYKLPENVGAFAGRFTLSRGKIDLMSEYAYKINDPSTENGNIYKPGQSLLVQGTYSKKGLGIVVASKYVDNMGFRSDRTALDQSLMINYLPTISKQHVYALSAIYPYATQSNGEMGINASILYKIKKKSLLGGKYGTSISLNYSRVHGLKKSAANDSTAIGEAYSDGYDASFMAFGEDKYFEDFSIEISKKFNKKFKGNLSYVYLDYNMNVMEGHGEESVKAHIAIADGTYKLSSRNSLHFEMQHLATKEDDGNWAQALIEFSTRKYFVALMDMYNYGNSVEAQQIHYFSVAGGYTHNTSRVTLMYGKQREGILCVGGVCRSVPAANGFTLSLTSSF